MPNPTHDMKFEIDALFDHMATNLGHQPDDERDWHFAFRSPDVGRLEAIGEELSEEFDVELQEVVESQENGREIMGPPMLSIMVRGVLTAEDVKSLAARFEDLARAKQIVYEGVASYDPGEDDEFMGWLALDEAQWRLRSFTDSGLPKGAEIPLAFAIAAEDHTHVQAIVKALKDAGLVDVEASEDDDQEDLGVIVNIEGKNDEAALAATYEKIQRIAHATSGEMLGVQIGEDEDAGDEEDEE